MHGLRLKDWAGFGEADADGVLVDELGGSCGIDADAVVGGVELRGQFLGEGPVLGGGELAFEDAALYPVEVLAAGLEHDRIPLGEGVIDEDDEHEGLPPGPEWLVGGVFEAEPDELECFQVDQLLVGHLAAQAAVIDGGGEFRPDQLGDLLAALGAEGRVADAGFEVGLGQRLLRGGAPSASA